MSLVYKRNTYKLNLVFFTTTLLILAFCTAPINGKIFLTKKQKVNFCKNPENISVLWCHYRELKAQYRIAKSAFQLTKFTQDFESKEFKDAYERAFLLSRSIVAAYHIDVFRTAKKCVTLELEMTVVKFRLEYFKMVLKEIKRDIRVPIESFSKRDSVPIDLICGLKERERLQSSMLHQKPQSEHSEGYEADSDEFEDKRDPDHHDLGDGLKDLKTHLKQKRVNFKDSRVQSESNMKSIMKQEREKETEEVMKKSDEYMAKRRTTYETIQTMIEEVLANIRGCLSIPELEDLPMKFPK